MHGLANSAGRACRVGLAVAAGLALITGGCRGGGDSGSAPAAGSQPSAGRPGVIFVGLDGADWQDLDQRMAAGQMPNLQRLVAEGRGGALTTIQPPLSPLVWTTMVTGVSPLQHGILDFTRFSPASGVREPITSDERRVPAVWNMVSDAGREVAVFDLWATYPAERVRGLLVSDRLFSFLHQQEAPPPGAVYPAAEEKWAQATLARVEREVDFAALRAYLPWLDEAEYGRAGASDDPYARPVSALRRILVETRVYDRLAKDWLERQRPALTILYLQGTDTIGHVFAPYAPPRQPQISDADFGRYSDVAARYFTEVDGLLGEYRRLAERDGAVLFVASDHGFLWHEGRPARLSSSAMATAGQWHREEGIYLLWGKGIAAEPGHRGKGGVAQTCATFLALLGLPAGRGLAGPPLGGVPEASRPPVDYAAHFTPERPATPATPSGPSAEAGEDVAKLRALGYIAAGEMTTAPAGASPGSTRTPASYNNQGLIEKDAGHPAEAVVAFERALALDPHLLSASFNLSELLFEQESDLDRADLLLVQAVGAGLPQGPQKVVQRALAYQRGGKLARSVSLLDHALAAGGDQTELLIFRGRFRIEAGDCRGAASDFESAVRREPRNAVVHASLGIARLCLGDRAGGRRELERSLELDPSQPQVRAALARLDAEAGAADQ